MAWEDLLQRPGQSNGLAEFLLNARQMDDQHALAAPQLQLARAQAQEATSKAARDQQFQADWAQYSKNPTPQALLDLQGKYPEKAQGISKIYDAKDTATRTSDLGYFGSLYSALKPDKNGKLTTGADGKPLAATVLSQRIAADKAAGLDTSQEEQYLQLIQGGDVNAAAALRGMVLPHLAAAAGPDKFASTFGVVTKPDEAYTLGPGMERRDGDNQVVAKAPFAPQYRNVGQGDTLVEVGGGGQASGAPGTGATGPRRVGGYTPRSGENSDAALAGKYGVIKKIAGLDPDAPLGSVADADRLATAIIASEGKPAAKNNVGNIEDGAFARSQPGYAGKDGRWATFDTPTAGANAVKNLIRRKYANGFSTVRDVIEGKVVGGGTSTPQAGGATVVATGAPKPQYQMLAPEETQALGLDPNVKYQRAPDGQITALGGQSKAQLKPIPPAAAKDIIENRRSLRNIDTTLDEIAKYPDAIGPTTGMLGNWWSQIHDPKGVPARSALANIGSLIIHDRSGAAVTVSETPRLQPFIPLVTDPPAVAKQKLARLRAEIGGMNADYEAQYSEEQGYRPFKGAGDSAGAGGMPRPRSIQEAMKLPSGTKFIDPKGVVRTRP